MNKKLELIVISIIIIISITGCTYVKPPQELIKRPQSTIENENYNIISEFLGKNRTLTLTKSQKKEEAIRRIDIDGDKKDELLVLYKNIHEKNKRSEGLGILILKKKEDKWYEINKLKEFGDNFDLVECVDITDDDKPEIFIGTSTEDKVDKNLVVYSYQNGYFHNVYQSNYRDLGIEDLNKDNINDIVILDKRSENNKKYIKAITYSNGDMVTMDEYVIYNDSYYITMTVGKASKNQPAIFIDHDVGTYKGYTDIVVMKNNKLTQVLAYIRVDYGEILGSTNVKSKDINKDGIIEIGFMGKKKILDEYKEYDVLYVHRWYRWNKKNDITLVRKEYYNYDLGYKVLLPLEWEDDFVILQKIDQKEIEFYSLDITGKLDKQFFYIKSFNRKEWEKERSTLDKSTYLFLKEDKDNIVIAVASDRDKESKYYLDNIKFKNMFSLIEE